MPLRPARALERTYCLQKARHRTPSGALSPACVDHRDQDSGHREETRPLIRRSDLLNRKRQLITLCDRFSIGRGFATSHIAKHLAWKQHPDYGREANSKRDDVIKRCLLAGNAPPISPPTPRESSRAGRDSEVRRLSVGKVRCTRKARRRIFMRDLHRGVLDANCSPLSSQRVPGLTYGETQTACARPPALGMGSSSRHVACHSVGILYRRRASAHCRSHSPQTLTSLVAQQPDRLTFGL